MRLLESATTRGRNFFYFPPLHVYTVCMRIDKTEKNEMYTISLNHDELSVLQEISLHGTKELDAQIYVLKKAFRKAEPQPDNANMLELLEYYKAAGDMLTATMIQFFDSL